MTKNKFLKKNRSDSVENIKTHTQIFLEHFGKFQWESFENWFLWLYNKFFSFSLSDPSRDHFGHIKYVMGN